MGYAQLNPVEFVVFGTAQGCLDFRVLIVLGTVPVTGGGRILYELVLDPYILFKKRSILLR
jgi:hypothetical protein